GRWRSSAGSRSSRTDRKETSGSRAQRGCAATIEKVVANRACGAERLILQRQHPVLPLLFEPRHVGAAEHADQRFVAGRVGGDAGAELVIEAVEQPLLLKVEAEIARLRVAAAGRVETRVAVAGHRCERPQLAGADVALKPRKTPVR